MHPDHDDDIIFQGAGGLNGILIVLVLVLPLHPFLDDGARLWVISMRVQKEITRSFVLHSQNMRRSIQFLDEEMSRTSGNFKYFNNTFLIRDVEVELDGLALGAVPSTHTTLVLLKAGAHHIITAYFLTLPIHTYTVWILVGAADARFHQLLHVHHNSCLFGLAV